MSEGAVFLDRDGVLNSAVVRSGKPYPPASVSELVLLPGAPEACSILRAAGLRLIGVTNQPDIGRRVQTREQVDAINAAVRSACGLDDLRVCPHDDPDDCRCRKPAPGLLI